MPVPPAQDDGADDDDGDGPGAEGPGGGGLLDDVDEDDDYPPPIEGAPAPEPRMSERERRGVPPQCLIEVMIAAEESANGRAPATYGEAL